MTRWLPWIALIVVVLGFANFLWFIAESASLGGDGLNGYVRDGHYYVTSHGKATEVSQTEWQWSRAHAGITIGTHLLAMAGLAYLMFRVFLPAMLPSQAPDASKRLGVVRASGPVIAARRCAGQLGDLRLSGPLLDVAVHRAGIVLTPPLMAPVVLLADEVEGVSWDKSWGHNRLTIDYLPGAFLGPIRLFVSPNDPLAVAIERQVAGRHDPQERASSPAAVASNPARFAKYPLIMRIWLLGALVLSVPFLMSRAEPGPNASFLFGLAIIGFNVYWFLIRERHRW